MKEVKDIGRIRDIRFVGAKPCEADFRFKVYTDKGTFALNMTEKHLRITEYGVSTLAVQDGTVAICRAPRLLAALARLIKDDAAMASIETGDSVPLFEDDVQATAWLRDHDVPLYKNGVVADGFIDVHGEEVA